MKVSLVIPAYNEEKTIRKVIDAGKKARNVNEIIVIDDGSTDKTYDIAISTGVKVIRHAKNKGKGSAIKLGIKKSRGSIICFIDADINWKKQKIEMLIDPIIKDEADFVKSSFTRKRGRLTELLAKPLINKIFSGMSFSQPLSGQFAGKKDFLENIDIEDKWGIDIGILLDAIKHKQRIKEVDIGNIIHKKRPMEEIIKTADDVVNTIFKKAVDMEEFILFDKQKLITEPKGIVAFDLDGTLIKQSSIEKLARKFNFLKKLLMLRFSYIRGKKKEYEITIGLAESMKGKNKDDVYSVCDKIEIVKNAESVIKKLKEKGYVVVIISSAFSPVVEYFSKKLGVEEFYCPELISVDSKYTGQIQFSGIFDDKCCSQSVCKKKVLLDIAEKYKLNMDSTVAVGNGKNDLCMLNIAGTGIVIGHSLSDKKTIDDLSEILLYVE